MYEDTGSSRTKSVKLPASPLIFALPATDADVHRIPMAGMILLPRSRCSASRSGSGEDTDFIDVLCHRSICMTSASSSPLYLGFAGTDLLSIE